MKRTFLAGVVGFGFALLSSAPAFAGSATVTPTPAAPGGFVTITVTCTDPGATVTFVGDPAVFVGGGAFNNVSSGSANGFQLLPDLAPGVYPETFVCSGEGSETLQAQVVVAATPTPSGAPETGGGGALTDGRPAGIAAIVIAGLVGAWLLVARLRRNG